MEAIRIRVVEVVAGVATVEATSVKCVDGKPEAEITIQLQVPDGPSRREILDRALAYLDPA